MPILIIILIFLAAPLSSAKANYCGLLFGESSVIASKSPTQELAKHWTTSAGQTHFETLADYLDTLNNPFSNTGLRTRYETIARKISADKKAGNEALIAKLLDYAAKTARNPERMRRRIEELREYLKRQDYTKEGWNLARFEVIRDAVLTKKEIRYSYEWDQIHKDALAAEETTPQQQGVVRLGSALSYLLKAYKNEHDMSFFKEARVTIRQTMHRKVQGQTELRKLVLANLATLETWVFFHEKPHEGSVEAFYHADLLIHFLKVENRDTPETSDLSKFATKKGRAIYSEVNGQKFLLTGNEMLEELRSIVYHRDFQALSQIESHLYAINGKINHARRRAMRGEYDRIDAAINAFSNLLRDAMGPMEAEPGTKGNIREWPFSITNEEVKPRPPSSNKEHRRVRDW